MLVTTTQSNQHIMQAIQIDSINNTTSHLGCSRSNNTAARLCTVDTTMQWRNSGKKSVWTPFIKVTRHKLYIQLSKQKPNKLQ